jgi:hypothetical protein
VACYLYDIPAFDAYCEINSYFFYLIAAIAEKNPEVVDFWPFDDFDLRENKFFFLDGFFFIGGDLLYFSEIC